jgi:DNA-binding NarL/FixJ family response regulator
MVPLKRHLPPTGVCIEWCRQECEPRLGWTDWKEQLPGKNMSTSTKILDKEIRILIADDHPIVREGLVTILALQNDLKIVGQARDGEEACLLYDELSPDVLILDLRMPKKDGQEVVSELMSRRPRPRIVVLTNSAKEEDLRRALIAGAKGYLLKGAEPQQVWDTVREVSAGKSSLPHDVAAQLANSMAQPQLSQRELQVLEQLALGKSNKEIGQFLYISENTVKNHVRVILKKLNAIGRTEALAIASHRGLINMG